MAFSRSVSNLEKSVFSGLELAGSELEFVEAKADMASSESPSLPRERGPTSPIDSLAFDCWSSNNPLSKDPGCFDVVDAEFEGGVWLAKDCSSNNRFWMSEDNCWNGEDVSVAEAAFKLLDDRAWPTSVPLDEPLSLDMESVDKESPMLEGLNPPA